MTHRTTKGINAINYPDASSTYRGYRRQALYVLHRVLTADADVTLRPEYREDLAIYGSDGKLEELIQVKDYSQPLQLSDFDPAGKRSFFARCAEAIDTHPSIRLRLSTFGAIGPELRGAIEQDGPSRHSVSAKIAKHQLVNESTARQILSRLEIEDCSETRFLETISKTLERMVTSLDPSEAFDALNYWIYQCSEKQQRITRQDVSTRISRIGQFIGDMASHHAEWLSTIRPIDDADIESDRLRQLQDEFHSGVAARYEHILAQLDVARPEWMNAITEKLSTCNVVFLHAPSGEGKSTLAYRYLKEYTPGIARFEVKHIADATHALRIARALGSHVRSLGLPVTVYLDIPPQHDGWIALIKELSFYREIKQIATIREEDWRRANVSEVEFRWTDLELGFGEAEARELFQRLAERSSTPKFTSFDEAWQRFGGQGPLLEFVYLVTQGGLLQERLKEQIERIQDQVRGGQRAAEELDLLCMVSVASTFASRLLARPLLAELQFPKSGNPLNLLEKEYLVRTSGDGLFIEGLHPIRSRFISELLCDPLTRTWGETAKSCLPFLDEYRLESFLLGAFSENTELEAPLFEGLCILETPSWNQVAGIVRALLGLGVSRYARTNRDLILHVENDLGLPWMLALDIDVASLTQRESPYGKDFVPIEAWEKMEELRARQSSKTELFTPLKEWLMRLPPSFDS